MDEPGEDDDRCEYDNAGELKAAATIGIARTKWRQRRPCTTPSVLRCEPTDVRAASNKRTPTTASTATVSRSRIVTATVFRNRAA